MQQLKQHKTIKIQFVNNILSFYLFQVEIKNQKPKHFQQRIRLLKVMAQNLFFVVYFHSDFKTLSVSYIIRIHEIHQPYSIQQKMRVRKIQSRKLKSSTDDEINKMIRFKRTHLEQLQKENIEFKVVLESYKKKPNDVDPSGLKEMQFLYQQTRNLEVKQDSELKKQNLLKQLIGYLQEEQVMNKKQQDIIRSALKANHQKQLKKRQYDVQQILQKCNYEVAKISTLREQVAVSRSQRVVYSSLFKKLERQIRTYEQQFKQLLLTSTSIQQKRQKTLEFGQIFSMRKKADKQTPLLQIQLSDEQQIQQLSVRNQFSIKKNHQNNKKLNQTRSDFKFKQINTKWYEQLKMFMDAITIQSQSENFQDLIHRLLSVQQQNNNLVEKIQNMSTQIFFLEEQKASFCKSNPHDQEAQENTNSMPLFSNVSFLCSEKLSQIEQNQHHLLKIAQLLKIPYYQPVQTNELFSMIDKSLQKIIKVEDLHVSKMLDDQQMISRRGDQQQYQIVSMIERVQKYFESQKIFQKQSFQQEYIKETSRIRRMTKPKR